MRVSKTQIVISICIMIFFFGTNSLVAQYVDILNPFTVDDNTVLLMHFDGDLNNESTLSEDGEAEGRINFIPGLPNLGQAVWIDNDAPDVDTSMVVVAHSEALNLKTSFTIEGWSNNITFDGGGGTARSYHPWVLRKGTAGGGNDAHYGIMVNPTTHNFEATTTYSDGYIEQIECRLVTNHGTVDLGQWYHFAFFKDFDSGVKMLAVHKDDGTLYQWASSFLPSDTTAYNDEPLFFGLVNQGHTDIGEFYWNGFLDEVRLSDVVRDYSLPPVIGNVGTAFEGHNPRAGKPVKILAEVRMIGNNTLDGVPMLHYQVGDGNWQEVSMMQGDSENSFYYDLPGQPKATTVSYYITAINQDGLEGRFPEKYGNFSAVGFWDIPETTLDITFEEGPGDTPTDYSIYEHEIVMLGENLSYSEDVPPALSGESNYSMAWNQDITEELPDTSGLMIPEPTPFINGEYDDAGNYGWTVDFWMKVDTSYWQENNQMMVARTGIITSQTPGHLMHRFDVYNDGDMRMRFYQHWAQLRFNIPGLGDGKWFHAMIGETQDLYFARFFDENESLVAQGTQSKAELRDTFDPPYSTINVFFGQSWGDNDFRGWLDNIKWHNYPKDLPPTVLDFQAVNVLENQPLELKATITHPGTDIDNVTLHYTFSEPAGQWLTSEMSLESGATYRGELPAQPMGTVVQYYLSVEATNGLRSTYPANAETQNVYASNAWCKANTQTLDLTFEEGPTGPPVDNSDYQQPLVLYGNPQYSEDALDGDYSLAFDGEESYIEIDPAPFFASEEYTVDFWFKADSSIDKGVRFMVQEADADWSDGPFHIMSRGDWIRDHIYVEGPDGIYRIRFNLKTEFETGKWYRHVLDVSADSAFAELRDSSNVVIDRKSTGIDGHPVLEDGPFRLGAGRPDQCFTGKMDNVRIYNYSVSNPGTKVAEQTKEVPSRFSLSQNYPNPFNPTTTIKYTIPSAEQVSLIVYDVLGRQVKKLVDKKMSAGEYNIHWDGKNEADVNVASGVYFYQLEMKNEGVTKTQVRKMVLVR
ncbi:T9SS type A sorting domain-containing protein [candidate division KSB1 bacterium]|nr:T9SS type A sorting domain-containing protein [candidate division KSB1 bacterium]